MGDIKIKDEEILTLSLKNPSFFEKIVDKYQDSFLRTANRIVNQKEEAEDIVQEVFTKIYINAHKFQNIDRGSFKSWAYKILINTSLSHFKKQKKIKENFKDLDPQLYEAIPDKINSDFDRDIDMQLILKEAMSKMPKHLQDAIRKYYFEDRPQKEIAREEGISLLAFKMRLYRAKKMLKYLLGGNNYQF